MTQYADVAELKADIQAVFVTGKITAKSIKRDDHVVLLDNIAETLFALTNATFTPSLSDYNNATYYYVGGVYDNNTTAIVRNSRADGTRSVFAGDVADLATDWSNRTSLTYV